MYTCTCIHLYSQAARPTSHSQDARKQKPRGEKPQTAKQPQGQAAKSQRQGRSQQPICQKQRRLELDLKTSKAKSQGPAAEPQRKSKKHIVENQKNQIPKREESHKILRPAWLRCGLRPGGRLGLRRRRFRRCTPGSRKPPRRSTVPCHLQSPPKIRFTLRLSTSVRRASVGKEAGWRACFTARSATCRAFSRSLVFKWKAM